MAAAGTYYVEVQSASGCDTTLSATIQDMPQPQISVSPTDTTIRYGDSIMLYAACAQAYTWQPDDFIVNGINSAEALVQSLKPILYTVIGSNQYGCEDTGLVNINIDYTMPILIPNAFSPNGDGLNDVFKIEGFTYQTIKQFYIFNRFGQLIFSTMDVNKGWDGTQNGKPCDVGTYFYSIKIAFPDGSSKTFKGDISLIR